MLNPVFDALPAYPFERLNTLLDGVTPGAPPVPLHIGEPQAQPPALLGEALARAGTLWNRYPPAQGTQAFRAAVTNWAARRFGLPHGLLDPDRHAAPCPGSREALFLAAFAIDGRPRAGRPAAILMPDPQYHVYPGAALIAGAEPVYLPTRPETGHLPDLDALEPALLQRTALFYLCSPSNPQGAVADIDYLTRALSLARRHGFLLGVDECYSEIHQGTPPPGALQAAAALGPGDGGDPLDNLLVFNSLSKRSNAAGLRSGVLFGAAPMIQAYARLVGCGGAPTPLPVLEAAIALWSDEAHVEANRARYTANHDIAEAMLGAAGRYERPTAGFFAWHHVGDGEDACRRLWRAAGLRVLPGAYMSPAPMAVNPGAPYIRVALVHEPDEVRAALSRMAAALDDAA